ncbi:hypothetical protein GCM10023196_082800 [Actinoallomurus vinaceus]|uniref:TIGR04222 domain-containing membrane protein n=1 Tax=Actinoallomurus vinaceus TaxID=1080074 RepID=A0ABP8US42_9ACTN
MPEHDLSPYEIAYLFAGPDRVAMVALVALHTDGRIRITPDRHRVYAEQRPAAEPTETTTPDPVETTVLAVIPDVGRVLGLTRALIAASPAVAEIGRRLRADGLLPHSRMSTLRRRRNTRSRSLRRELAEAADGLVRVAVKGTPGIADEELRMIFETHVYAPPAHSPLINPKRDRPVDPLHAPIRMNPSVYGYSDGGGYGDAGGFDVGGYGDSGGSDGGGSGW